MKQRKKNSTQKTQSITVDLLDNFKQPSVPVTGIPKVGSRQKECLEEIIVKNFLNLMKIINAQIIKAQQTPNTRNMKKSKAHHNQIAQNRNMDLYQEIKSIRNGNYIN